MTNYTEKVMPKYNVKVDVSGLTADTIAMRIEIEKKLRRSVSVAAAQEARSVLEPLLDEHNLFIAKAKEYVTLTGLTTWAIDDEPESDDYDIFQVARAARELGQDNY